MSCDSANKIMDHGNKTIAMSIAYLLMTIYHIAGNCAGKKKINPF